MSEGFSADWLDLREPYDAAACSSFLRDHLVAWCHGRETLRIVDLGAGTGAQLRRLSPRLGTGQHWILVEHDPALIAAGGARLAAVGVSWRYRCLDLARDLEALATERADLIAASALIDLVAAPWLGRLLALRAAAGAALYLTLCYDGRMVWEPADPGDAEIAALVDRHQRTDKGFGPALGPEAAASVREALAGLPGELLTERSDWRLGEGDAAIQTALLAGYLEAAAAIAAPAARRRIAAWGERRARLVASRRSRLTVGHLDLLFLPPG
ncbi:class I SAM-dependent methyltransferase [Benzoatithermus flavus]|uniref:Class I SAM-dependent methyltransferase n=1 Tax=Benzoatithermus flavus TaxID=3108223 RepID=A0ABU8XVY7_9PROT